MKTFKTIGDYCLGINIPAPRHPHFDIRSFAENMPTVLAQMPPFRHEFYALAIKVEGKGKAITGHFTDFPDGSVVFFNSPFQILSWDILPDWQGYYFLLTQDFLTQSPYFNDLLEEFPFFKIAQAIPFQVDQEDTHLLLQLFQKIYQEYHSNHPDKFALIASYVLLILRYVKRYYLKQVDPQTAQQALRKADINLLSRYKELIRLSFQPDHTVDTFSNLQSTSYYARQLNIHPNHLNAVVKEITGQTALQHIHHHLVNLAKSLLVQTDQSVKEIAYSLFFDSPNNFSIFCKKHTQKSPSTYRKEALL